MEVHTFDISPIIWCFHSAKSVLSSPICRIQPIHSDMSQSDVKRNVELHVICIETDANAQSYWQPVETEKNGDKK